MISHQGGINRVRSMQQQPHIVATWGENGYVQVWDMSAHLRALSTLEASASTGLNNVYRQAPLHIFTGHKDEGFALDWSSVTPGRLLSGIYSTNKALHFKVKTLNFVGTDLSEPSFVHR